MITLGGHRDLSREAPVERDRPLGPDLARLVEALERDELPLP